ncbi:unnamed protein product, partial [Gulo gulo]
MGVPLLWEPLICKPPFWARPPFCGSPLLMEAPLLWKTPFQLSSDTSPFSPGEVTNRFLPLPAPG